jgi:hypothetical protein
VRRRENKYKTQNGEEKQNSKWELRGFSIPQD